MLHIISASLYNLIIHLSNNNVDNGFMHIWTESTAGRGSTEIASCLLAFAELSPINKGKLVAWSDSCARQNKNFFVICMWMILVQKGIFTSITHKFPEIGHSWMPSDRDGGLIEKKVRMKECIYDTASYRDCIIQAKNDNQFEVREMKGHFIDIKEEVKKGNLVNKKINTKGGT